MHIPHISKKIIIIVLIVLLIVLMVTYYVFLKMNTVSYTKLDPEEAQELLEEKTQSINTLPQLPEEMIGGVDTTSPQVQSSIKSIRKISPFLPYSHIFTTKNKIKIEVFLPESKYMENEWTLSANVFGIDYMIPENHPQYATMKEAFKEGALDVISFLENHDVDPTKVYIQWGDRRFIQDRADRWIREK